MTQDETIMMLANERDKYKAEFESAQAKYDSLVSADKAEQSQLREQIESLKSAHNESVISLKTSHSAELFTANQRSDLLTMNHKAKSEKLVADAEAAWTEINKKKENLDKQLEGAIAIAEKRRLALADLMKMVAAVVDKIMPLISQE